MRSDAPRVDRRHGGTSTDPAAAAEFVAATERRLAGRQRRQCPYPAHTVESGLDLRLLEEIRKRVPVPLVLHGGTGNLGRCR